VSDVDDAKRSLSRLLDDAPVVRGERALRSLDAAVRFRESGGIDRLRRVADRHDGAHGARASRVVASFDRLRTAARRDSGE
jgi:hypothetical protein